MYAEIFGADSPFVIAHSTIIIIIKVFSRRAVYHPQPEKLLLLNISLCLSLAASTSS